MEKPANLPDWVTVEPGGIFHYDIPKLMKASGIPDSPENRQTTMEVAEQILKDMYPGVPLETRP